MTLVFRISPAKKCQLCYGPVKDFIYQHQCRPNFQPFCCYNCLIDRDICRYCFIPYTFIKETTTTWAGQLYFDKPDPPGPRNFSKVENLEEDDFQDDFQDTEEFYGPYPIRKSNIFDSLSYTDFWGGGDSSNTGWEGETENKDTKPLSSHIQAKWNSNLSTEEYKTITTHLNDEDEDTWWTLEDESPVENLLCNFKHFDI